MGMFETKYWQDAGKEKYYTGSKRIIEKSTVNDQLRHWEHIINNNTKLVKQRKRYRQEREYKVKQT